MQGILDAYESAMKFMMLARQLSDLCIQLSTVSTLYHIRLVKVTQHVLDHFHCLMMDRKSGTHSQCPKLCLTFYILWPELIFYYISRI
jgi:hypothetical protein